MGGPLKGILKDILKESLKVSLREILKSLLKESLRICSRRSLRLSLGDIIRELPTLKDSRAVFLKGIGEDLPLRDSLGIP